MIYAEQNFLHANTIEKFHSKSKALLIKDQHLQGRQSDPSDTSRLVFN